MLINNHQFMLAKFPQNRENHNKTQMSILNR